MPDETGVLNEDGSYAHVNENDSVLDIMNHPAFDGFGQFILPSDNGITPLLKS
jgi:hypothetical protein